MNNIMFMGTYHSIDFIHITASELEHVTNNTVSRATVNTRRNL